MNLIRLFLLVFAVVFLLLQAFGVSHPRCSFGWLGVALFVVTFLIPT